MLVSRGDWLIIKLRGCLENFLGDKASYGGFHRWGGTPIAGWFLRENTIEKWMITIGVPLFQDTSNDHCYGRLDTSEFSTVRISCVSILFLCCLINIGEMMGILGPSIWNHWNMSMILRRTPRTLGLLDRFTDQRSCQTFMWFRYIVWYRVW